MVYLFIGKKILMPVRLLNLHQNICQDCPCCLIAATAKVEQVAWSESWVVVVVAAVA